MNAAKLTLETSTELPCGQGLCYFLSMLVNSILFWVDFDEIFRTVLPWYMEQLIKFGGGDMDPHADSPNHKFG